MRFLQSLTILLVVSLPFLPLQLDTRLIFAIAGFALLLSPVFIKNFSEDIQKRKPITIFFLLFLLAATLSTIFSIDRERSLFYLLLYFACFIIFTSIRSVFSTEKSQKLLVTCYLLLVTVLSAISLYNTLVLNYVNKEATGVSFMWVYFGHNHLANLLIFAIPLSILLWKSKPLPHLHTTFYVLFITFLVASLFFTMSRAGMLALFFACIFGLAVYGKNLKLSKITLATFVCVAVLFTLIFNILADGKDFVISKGKIKIDERYNRIVYWQQAIQNFKEHPILGSGINTFNIVNKKAEQPKKILRSDFAHNFFFQMLSDTGILGFLSSLGLIGAILWQAFRKLHQSPHRRQSSLRAAITSHQALNIAIFTGLLASVIMAMFDISWQIPYVFMLFFIFAAILLL